MVDRTASRMSTSFAFAQHRHGIPVTSVYVLRHMPRKPWLSRFVYIAFLRSHDFTAAVYGPSTTGCRHCRPALRAAKASAQQMHHGEVAGTPQPPANSSGRPSVSMVTVLILVQVRRHKTKLVVVSVMCQAAIAVFSKALNMFMEPHVLI